MSESMKFARVNGPPTDYWNFKVSVDGKPLGDRVYAIIADAEQGVVVAVDKNKQPFEERVLILGKVEIERVAPVQTEDHCHGDGA